MTASPMDVSMEDDTASKNFDALMTESESFLEQIRSIPEFEGNYLLKFKAWRSKRRDKNLFLTMTNLIGRIKASEEQLRDTIIQVVEKKLALRDQARHLKCRLNSCITYNTDFVQSQEQFVEGMRNNVNGLSSESSDLKAAVAFNCELVRQKIIQTVKQNRTFVSCKFSFKDVGLSMCFLKIMVYFCIHAIDCYVIAIMLSSIEYVFHIYLDCRSSCLFVGLFAKYIWILLDYVVRTDVT